MKAGKSQSLFNNNVSSHEYMFKHFRIISSCTSLVISEVILNMCMYLNFKSGAYYGDFI